MSFLPLPLDVSKWVRYRKETPGDDFIDIDQLDGLQFTEGEIHRHIGLNQFEAETTKIPTGFTRTVKTNPVVIPKYVYDPTRPRLVETDHAARAIADGHIGWKTYLTHDNGGRPFLVYVQGANVDVFATPTKPGEPFIAESDMEGEPKQWHYVVPVASYTNVVNLFIGTSPKCPMTEFSGGHGPEFTGNSVLVQLSALRYAHIGSSVYEFQTSDQILEYWSPVGNNDVPYPVAIGTKYAYFMLDQRRVPLARFSRSLTRLDKCDLYRAYYNTDYEDPALLPISNRHDREFVCIEEVYATDW